MPRQARKPCSGRARSGRMISTNGEVCDLPAQLQSAPHAPISAAFSDLACLVARAPFSITRQIRICDPSEWFERAMTPLCVFKEAKMATDTVKFFNVQKGFIAQDGGGPDVFVHISALERAGMSNLVDGQKLRFNIQADPRKGKSAANLQPA